MRSVFIWLQNIFPDILKMYFEEHMKQKDIAEILNVTAQYISKVVAKDDRYVDEKSLRHKESKKRKKAR